MLIVQAVISDQVHTGHFKMPQMLEQLLDCAIMSLESNIIMQLFSLLLTEFQYTQVWYQQYILCLSKPDIEDAFDIVEWLMHSDFFDRDQEFNFRYKAFFIN